MTQIMEEAKSEVVGTPHISHIDSSAQILRYVLLAILMDPDADPDPLIFVIDLLGTNKNQI